MKPSLAESKIVSDSRDSCRARGTERLLRRRRPTASTAGRNFGDVDQRARANSALELLRCCRRTAPRASSSRLCRPSQAR